MLEQTNAFRDPVEADAAGVRLVLPEPQLEVEAWRVAGGPREYTQTSDGADIDVGWVWELERGGDRRSIRVEVAGGRFGSAHLPDESQEAIRTQGRSALEELLVEPDPPTRVLVTSSGIFTR